MKVLSTFIYPVKSVRADVATPPLGALRVGADVRAK